jgi:hypothetical protein
MENMSQHNYEVDDKIKGFISAATIGLGRPLRERHKAFSVECHIR